MIRFAFLIFSSIPVVISTDCGLIPEIPKNLRDKYSTSPWNVAIFDLNRKQPVQICGGTIISEHLVISAAHCFYNELTRALRRSSNYEIVVSKISRKYNEKDNPDTEWYKLREIHIPNSYHEWLFFQTSDIVILETINPIILKSTVAPACIAWDRNDRIEPQTGTFGKGLSWGAFTDEEILHEFDLPYSSYMRCLNVSPEYIKPYITLDKFCIENVTDHSLRLGDAGTGFFCAKNFRYHLVGVVSIQMNFGNHSMVGCTDIYHHLNWITKIHELVRQQIFDVELEHIHQNEELNNTILAESVNKSTEISNPFTQTPKSLNIKIQAENVNQSTEISNPVTQAPKPLNIKIQAESIYQSTESSILVTQTPNPLNIKIQTESVNRSTEIYNPVTQTPKPLNIKIQGESVNQSTETSNLVTQTPKLFINDVIDPVAVATVINKYEIVLTNNISDCQLPVNMTGRNYTVQCPNDDCLNSNSQQIVPQFTTLTVTCDNDSIYEHEDPSSICHYGAWKPIIANCSRRCKKLHPVNVVLTCFLDGKEINCDGNNMKIGTRVYPKCPPAYIPQGAEPNYREIVCQDDGEWDNLLFTCIPECGVPHIGGTKLIKGGVTSVYGDSPWHVAIYNISLHTLICGGTIITPYLIISAAHCFFDEATKMQKNSTDFEIVVSKVKRDYFFQDNDDTKAYKVKEIYFESSGYRGLLTNFANDIAILQTVEKIILKPTVRTACIEWTRYEKFNPPDGTPGKVVGWGVNDARAEGSETLLSAELPYVSYGKCVDIALPGFRQYITLDKFCAGNTTGPSVTKGDSGGGLMFNIRSLYYLYGVVSIKPNYETSMAAFTDISDHIEWINKVRNTVEKQIIREDSDPSNQKTIN